MEGGMAGGHVRTLDMLALRISLPPSLRPSLPPLPALSGGEAKDRGHRSTRLC